MMMMTGGNKVMRRRYWCWGVGAGGRGLDGMVIRYRSLVTLLPRYLSDVYLRMFIINLYQPILNNGVFTG